MTIRSSQERTTDALAAIPVTESLPAVFVSQAGTQATVNQGDTQFAVKSISPYPLIPGEAVRLERRGGDLLLLGPSLPRSALGKVTATGSPLCTVEYPSGSGVTQQMPYSTAYTPAVNDNVIINWESGGVVICKVTALPAVASPSTPGAGGLTTFHPAPFLAIDSGSFLSSRVSNDVYASDVKVGGWFYGSKIKDTIPDTAIILSAYLYLPIKQNYGYNPILATHTHATAPSGSLTMTTVGELAQRVGWVKIPNSVIDTLKAADGGVGFNHGGYNIFYGVATDGLSGALDITYQA
ncbi:MAG: hypothetical protein KF861_00300 [Planctomycetaceae bacterium]|nr:hypothetical protein [Planctomycetaceae bacterium]